MTTVTQSTGYCYVVEFSNGRIKVGTTKHLSTRLKTHKSLALSNGVVAIRFAHTKRHSNYLDNEKTLIEKLAKAGSVAHGREFFEFVEFDYATQCLRELKCNNVDPYEDNASISTSINHKQDIFSTKRDVPIYRVNPSIAVYEKSLKGNSGESGGVYEWEEVDNERFVYIFLTGVKQMTGLSKSGLTVFELVYRQVQENPGTDEIKISHYIASDWGINERAYRRGIKELLDREFLFKSLMDGVFFVNIRYMFNGDRLAFVKGYQRKKAAQPKVSVPFIAQSSNEQETP